MPNNAVINLAVARKIIKKTNAESEKYF